MNASYCGKCGKLVPCDRVERDGRVYLVKRCGACGDTEELISNDARRYYRKQALDKGFSYLGCGVKCITCPHSKRPNMVFIDITNRCNLNCPICINNTPSMGFLFEPPIRYFERIFDHFARQDPKPAIQLFGGEPTVRKDLFDIIRMARSRDLATRVVTNGIALANEEYCRRLIETKATILIAYDNDNPELYRVLRGSEKSLELKLKAIENIRKIGGAKVVLMSLVSTGFNDQDLPRLFDFCHERRSFIRGIYLMPLAHTWKREDLDLDPPRVTSEDLENAVERAFPGERVEFLPAGLLGSLKALTSHLRLKPLPFAGAHPNCESMYLLVSDGERYRPLSYYLRSGATEVAQALMDADVVMAKREAALDRGLFGKLLGALSLKRGWLRMRAFMNIAKLLKRHVRLGRLLKGSGLGTVWHGAAAPIELLLGKRSKHVIERHTRAQTVLQLIVLPFEDPRTLETHRLERCPAGFAYVDPDNGNVKTVSTCAWGVHKSGIMKKIAEQYAKAGE
jgi:hypothetical protein